MKFLYCEKCQDLVKESDTKLLSEIIGPLPEKILGPTLRPDKLIHYFVETRNLYGNQPFGVIGYCPVNHPVMCGDVREPDALEYFILFTCNSKRNKL